MLRKKMQQKNMQQNKMQRNKMQRRKQKNMINRVIDDVASVAVAVLKNGIKSEKGRQMVLASLPGDIFPAALCRSRPNLQLPHLIGICPIHHITPNKESRQKQKVTKAIPPSPRYLYTYPCKCTVG